MVEPAYISFDGKGGGEFAFGCVTGAIYGAGDGNAIEFTWDGNDEMDDANGDGWAELQHNGASKDISASTAEIKPTSLRGHGRLLQQSASTTSTTLGVLSLAGLRAGERSIFTNCCCRGGEGGTAPAVATRS